MGYNPLDAPNVGGLAGIAEWNGRVNRTITPPPDDKGVVYNNSSLDVYDNNDVLQFHAGPDGVSITQNLELNGDLINASSLQYNVVTPFTSHYSGNVKLGDYSQHYTKSTQWVAVGDYDPVTQKTPSAYRDIDEFVAEIPGMKYVDLEAQTNLNTGIDYSLPVKFYLGGTFTCYLDSFEGDVSNLKLLYMGYGYYDDNAIIQFSGGPRTISNVSDLGEKMSLDRGWYNAPFHLTGTGYSTKNPDKTLAKKNYICCPLVLTKLAGSDVIASINYEVKINGFITSTDADLMGGDLVYTKFASNIYL